MQPKLTGVYAMGIDIVDAVHSDFATIGNHRDELAKAVRSNTERLE